MRNPAGDLRRRRRAVKAVSPQSLDAAVAALAADPDLVPMAG